jgi:hypothetical protein
LRTILILYTSVGAYFSITHARLICEKQQQKKLHWARGVHLYTVGQVQRSQKVLLGVAGRGVRAARRSILDQKRPQPSSACLPHSPPARPPIYASK